MRHGFLLIDKPKGPTSHDVVAVVRKALSERSVGHLGTLDPAASGLLVLAVGNKALKVVQFYNNLTKEYLADIRLGAVSTTYDSEGIVEEVTPKPGWEVPDEMTVRRLLRERFTGAIQQAPPSHSAVHIGGQRAYELARAGKNIEMPMRPVEIHRCELLSYSYPDLRLSVACGSGTYIRSLASDIGELLHCGGYLSALRRTRVGEWNVDDAIAPIDAVWTAVLPLKDVLQNLPGIQVTGDEADDIRHGRGIERDVKPDTIAWFEGLPIAVVVPAGEGYARPRKVF